MISKLKKEKQIVCFQNRPYENGKKYSDFLNSISVNIGFNSESVPYIADKLILESGLIPSSSPILEIGDPPPPITIYALPATHDNDLYWTIEKVQLLLKNFSALDSYNLSILILAYFVEINKILKKDATATINDIFASFSKYNFTVSYAFSRMALDVSNKVMIDEFEFGKFECLPGYFGGINIGKYTDRHLSAHTDAKTRFNYINKGMGEHLVVDLYSHFVNTKIRPSTRIGYILDVYYGSVSRIVADMFWRDLESLSYKMNYSCSLKFQIDHLYTLPYSFLLTKMSVISGNSNHIINEICNNALDCFDGDLSEMKNGFDYCNKNSKFDNQDGFLDDKCSCLLKYISKGNIYQLKFWRYPSFKDSNFEMSLMNYVIAWESFLKNSRKDSTSTIINRLCVITYFKTYQSFSGTKKILESIYAIRSDFVHEGVINRELVCNAQKILLEQPLESPERSNDERGFKHRIRTEGINGSMFSLLICLRAYLVVLYEQVGQIRADKMRQNIFNHSEYLSYLDILALRISNNLELKRDELVQLSISPIDEILDFKKIVLV